MTTLTKITVINAMNGITIGITRWLTHKEALTEASAITNAAIAESKKLEKESSLLNSQLNDIKEDLFVIKSTGLAFDPLELLKKEINKKLDKITNNIHYHFFPELKLEYKEIKEECAGYAITSVFKYCTIVHDIVPTKEEAQTKRDNIRDKLRLRIDFTAKLLEDGKQNMNAKSLGGNGLSDTYYWQHRQLSEGVKIVPVTIMC